VNGCRVGNLGAGQFFNAQSQTDQLPAELAIEFAIEKQIGNGKLKGQAKHLPKKVTSFQVDDDRRI